MTVSEAESLVRGLQSLFDIVRLFQPESHHIISVQPGGKLVESASCCFDLWNRSHTCKECYCHEAVATGKRRERIELHNGITYQIVCSSVEIEGKRYGLECISRADDAVITGAVKTAQLSAEYKRRNASAYTDVLTGVYNHLYYEDNYASLEQEQAAALLEIDNLEGIRTEFGEEEANALLKATAAMIRENTRSNDVLIRSKNDRFLLLFRHIGNEIFLNRMERIRQNMSSLFLPEKPELHPTLSIGGIYRSAETPIRPDMLMARLSYAKKTGNTFYCPAENESAEAADGQLSEAERDIRTFTWDYHGIFAVDLSTGKMTTVQANRTYADWIRETTKGGLETFRRAFTERFILPEDRSQFLKETEPAEILEQLKKEEVYYINQRVLKNGEAHYYQIKITHDPIPGTPDRVLVGGHSVDTQTRRSLRRLESERQQEKVLRECIRILYSQVDMDVAIQTLLEKVTAYYGAERAYICSIEGEKHCVKNNYVFYASDSDRADIDALVKLDEMCFESWIAPFRNEGQLTVEVPAEEGAWVPAHRIMKENNIERMILAPVFSGTEIAGFLGLDNPQENYHDLFLLRSVAAFIYGEVLRRNLEAVKNNEQLSLIAGLATDYIHVSIANLNNNVSKVYRPSSEICSEIEGWEDIGDHRFKLQMFLDRAVVPEDREGLRAFMESSTVLAALENMPAVYHNFSALLKGTRVALQIKIVRCDQGEGCVLIGIKNVENERRREHQVREQLELTVSERTKELREKNRTLNRLNEDVIEFLGGLTEARDKESGEHINRVKGFTNILAHCVMENCPEYNLTPEKVEIITSASALHDLGKIMIPDNILLKPGRLTDEEFAVMKSHCQRGAEILQRSPRGWSGEYLQTSMDIVLCHHEKTDGHGYPNGLVGDEIPISAQIVSVADCYDALTTKRVYKDAYTPDVAFNMILNGRCGVFSQKILDCLIKCREQFERYVRGEEVTEAESETPIRSKESLAGIRILIAEDNEISRSIMQDILEGEGAAVLTAEDGQDALRILRQENRRIDAVLTDIVMPELDGLGLARAIRGMNDEKIRNVPIIALTGRSDPEIEESCRSAGMDAFLTKPITILALTKCLLNCLRKRSEELQRKVNSLMGTLESEPIHGALRMSDYTDMVQQLTEKLITGEMEPFALLDADVNDLKTINRLYGHERGDEYLRNCCRMLKEAFPESRIYRIGGDEFAVLATGKDYEERDKRLALLLAQMEDNGNQPEMLNDRASFAIGMGVFDREHDLSVAAVFARAEQAMLAQKRASKAK